jgi:predicted Rossmann fold flavoprotein
MYDVLIIGAGASGCFTALRLKEEDPSLNIAVVERQAKALQKVKISGGGRCNVTHNSDDIPYLMRHYPRQHKQLKGQLKQFSPSMMRAWLKRHGVDTQVEADGRVFPTTNDSQSIIDTFLGELNYYKVPIHFQDAVIQATFQAESSCFELSTQREKVYHAKRLVLATGSHASGYALASALGLSVTPLSPSLFTFVVDDSKLTACAGLSLAQVSLRLETGQSVKPFKQDGPLLMTHWGLSGPAILKLSAQAAVDLQASAYQARLWVNALPQQDQEATQKRLKALQVEHPKRYLKNIKPEEVLPWRYWEFLLEHLNIPADRKWAELLKKERQGLVEALHHLEIPVSGKGQFKEEFVTAGGVDSAALNLQHLEAKGVKGLYVVGELLNVDAMTGGFNFQHCWASADAVARAIEQEPL